MSPKEARKIDAFMHYGIAAAREAMQDSGLEVTDANKRASNTLADVASDLRTLLTGTANLTVGGTGAEITLSRTDGSELNLELQIDPAANNRHFSIVLTGDQFSKRGSIIFVACDHANHKTNRAKP